jgi:hypothetical protein
LQRDEAPPKKVVKRVNGNSRLATAAREWLPNQTIEACRKRRVRRESVFGLYSVSGDQAMAAADSGELAADSAPRFGHFQMIHISTGTAASAAHRK